MKVEITSTGYVYIPAEKAMRFPTGTALVQHLLPEGIEPGVREARWNGEAGALRIPLVLSEAGRTGGLGVG